MKQIQKDSFRDREERERQQKSFKGWKVGEKRHKGWKIYNGPFGEERWQGSSIHSPDYVRSEFGFFRDGDDCVFYRIKQKDFNNGKRNLVYEEIGRCAWFPDKMDDVQSFVHRCDTREVVLIAHWVKTWGLAGPKTYRTAPPPQSEWKDHWPGDDRFESRPR